ncbi:MAG: MFS transporter, partial [Candidatus Altiarchaeota archaeon]
LVQLVSLAFICLIKHKQEVKPIKFNLRKFFHRPHWNIKLFAFTGMLITFVEYMDYTVTIIFLKEVYKASLTQIGFVMGLGWLSYGITQILSGKHSDKKGRKKLYIYGGITAGLSALLIPNTSSLFGITLFFILLSAGHGIATPAIRGMTAESTSEKYRTQDFGFITTFEELGALVGFPAMGWIADNLGFNAAFYLRGLTILCVTIIVYLLIHKKNAQND